MTRIVAVDVSARWGGVALVEGREAEVLVVAEVGLWVRDSHASHLLRMIDRLLSLASWSRSSVDAYAATRGPGSFTGLRVGLGTVLGLGLASSRPALAVGTLPAMAEAFGPAEGERVPLLDAGRGDVFGARYDPDASPPVERVPPWVGPPSQAFQGVGGPLTLFGPGAGMLRDEDRSGAHPPFRIAQAPASVAAGAGRIAFRDLGSGEKAGLDLAPLYLRPPDAEISARGAP